MSSDARLVLLGWTLFGLSGVARLVLLAHASDVPVDGWDIVTTMVATPVWVAVTPLAAWSVRRFPLGPDRKGRGLLALLLAGPLLVVVHQVLVQSVMVVVKLRTVEPVLLWSNTSRNLQNNFVRVLMVVWPLLAILHAAAATRREQAEALRTARLEAEVVETTLATARAEVDPAFLLGTLDSLGPLIRKDGRAAEEVIVRLGDLLRRAYAGDDAGSPSREEIVREIGRLSRGELTAPASPAGS